jgi:hypothetical protein
MTMLGGATVLLVLLVLHALLLVLGRLFLLLLC